MFIVQPKKARWFPVEVEMYDDNGRKRTFSFDAQLETIDQSEFNEYLNAVRAASQSEEILITDLDLADKRLLGWRKVGLPDGTELEVTPENKNTLLEIPGVARGVARAWHKLHGFEGKK